MISNYIGPLGRGFAQLPQQGAERMRSTLDGLIGDVMVTECSAQIVAPHRVFRRAAFYYIFLHVCA